MKHNQFSSASFLPPPPPLPPQPLPAGYARLARAAGWPDEFSLPLALAGRSKFNYRKALPNSVAIARTAAHNCAATIAAAAPAAAVDSRKGSSKLD